MIKMRLGGEATEAQYSTMVNLIERYKKEPDKVYWEIGYGALMCEFDGLTIGIEKDGYAHS